MINLPLVSRTSLQLEPLAGVWEDVLQRPVEISQVFTIPSESLVIVIPSSACRVMDLIGAEVDGSGSGLITAGSISGAPICQNLIDLSLDAEMRVVGEENAREVMCLVWPMKVSTR